MSNDNDTPATATSTAAQKHNPLHGLTLEYIVTELVAGFGWENLGERIDIRCFTQDPSVASSLKFLRKTPWARTKVESLYLFMRREQARQKKWTASAATEAQQQQPSTPKAPKDDLPTIDINAPARTMAMGTAEADNGDNATDDDDDTQP